MVAEDSQEACSQRKHEEVFNPLMPGGRKNVTHT